MAERPPPSSQAALSSARLQHFNYLASQPVIERRHFSFDTDPESRRYSSSTAPVMDYDQTEGLGGISVSSYDSIEDDRSPIEPAVVRGYHYHGESDRSFEWTLYSCGLSMICINPVVCVALFV